MNEFDFYDKPRFQYVEEGKKETLQEIGYRWFLSEYRRSPWSPGTLVHEERRKDDSFIRKE